MSSKVKGCSYQLVKGRPSCKTNNTGVMDSRCHRPKKNCSVKNTSVSTTQSSSARKIIIPKSRIPTSTIPKSSLKENLPESSSKAVGVPRAEQSPKPSSSLGVASASVEGPQAVVMPPPYDPSKVIRKPKLPVSANQPVAVSAAAPEPIHVEYDWYCGFCKYKNLKYKNTCQLCNSSKSSKLFDGYNNNWVCLRCFNINSPAPPGEGCRQCGESEIILPINGSVLRRPVKDCDRDYCIENQINSWCFKHAMNNLIGQHKYFVGEFDGEIMDHGQINVMGVCKLETGEKLEEVGFTEPPTLDLAENMLLMCGPTVNVSTDVAERSANLGGYDIETIFNEYGDYESSIARINSEYLSNPQLLGFLIRIGLQAGDPNTNHFTALKKDTSCPRLFKYIESRIPNGDAPGPYSHCLEMGESVVEHFLHQHKDRIKSIQSVFKRT